ncbi:MAG: sigma-54-dependent Fis family transcriptional regulator [Deltaproteobacteria bacterium]|nr:sigma-54-dependent Fis family transcriptional regulator [Deltaproteobacteria bacterium]
MTAEKIGSKVPIVINLKGQTMLQHIIIVVDEPSLQKKLKNALTKPDTVVEAARDQQRFIAKLNRKICDLIVITDHCLLENVREQIRKLKEPADSPAIVVLTKGENDKEYAEFIAAGCDNVLSRELPLKKLTEILNIILQRRKKIALSIYSAARQRQDADISDFAAKSPAMQKFIKMLPRIAKSNSSVLILGETGVGKERLAHVLHRESHGRDGAFIAVHCGALPESLLESELFGHEQGAFTGATKDRRGCFELAHHGTLFLDEIGEMDLHLQSKLLRVLESHEIRRVGGEKSMPVDVRVMAATNRDLEQELKTKQFRKDLYYRLNVVSLTVPPLRDRKEDIPELVRSYIDYLGPRINCPVMDIETDAMGALCDYDWPGNVRELINIVERALLLCDNDKITKDDLPKSITQASSTPNIENWSEKLMAQPLKMARSSFIKSFEKDYLINLLRLTNGRVGEAAKKAGIDTRSLYDKMKRFNLNKKDFRPPK